MIDDLLKHLMSHSPHDEWSTWDRGQSLPESHSHWTGGGIVAIRPEVKAGCLLAVLEFRGKELGSFKNAIEAAKAIGGGEFDSRLAEPAATLGIPMELHNWNGFK